MEAQFSLTTSELVDLHLYLHWQASWRKQYRRQIGFLLPVSFILFALSFWGAGATALAIFLLLLAIIWGFFHQRLMEWRIRQFATGYYNHAANERYWATYHYRFTASGIHLSSEYGTTQLKWKAIQHVMERADSFWLFETMTSAHIIPKRALKEPAKFQAILAKYLPHAP